MITSRFRKAPESPAIKLTEHPPIVWFPLFVKVLQTVQCRVYYAWFF